MAEYRIDLGIGLQSDDFAGIQKKIKSLEDDPIKLKIDSSAVTSEINDIKTELNNLGKTKGLKLDTSKLETSLTDVKGDISEIKNLLGSLGSGTNMKGLTSSITQISTALDKASGKFDELTADLKALSNKDFSVNIGVKLGGGSSPSNSAAYGDYVRQELYPELKRQEQAITKYLAQYYNTNEISAVDKLYKSSGRTGGFQNIWTMLDQLEAPIKKGEVLGDRISQYRNFFKDISDMARMQGIDLSPVMSQFDKLPDELIESANNIKNGTAQVKNNLEELKNVFGGNVDGEQLSIQLDSIVTDLNEIKAALQSLSSGTSLDGLTISFKELSEVLDKLVSNITLVKNALDGGFDGMGKTIDGGNTEKAVQDQKELANASTQSANVVVQAEERKQQAYRETADAVEQVSKIKPSDMRQFDDDTADTKELNVELKKLETLARQIGQLDFKIVKSDYNDEISQVKEFERQLELLKKRYNETIKSLAGQDIDIGSITTSEFVEARNKIAEFEAKIDDTKRKLGEKLQLKLEAGDFSTQVAKVESDASKLSGTYDEVEKSIKEVNVALASMQSASADNDIERLISANNKYEDALKKVENQLKQNKIAEQNVAAQQKLNDDIGLFQSKIDAWLTKNSAAAKQFGSTMLDLQARAEGCDRTTLNHLEAEFKQVDRAAEAAGKKTQTLGDSLKTQFSKYSTYFGVAELFMYVEQGLRDMFEQVKLIDSAMTELKKVTDETDASYNRFLTNAASRAKEIGTTIDGLVSSTADFARLGYGFEDAQGLAEVANIYAVVGDEIEGVEGATESLISTLAAFKDEMGDMSNTDFAMSIIDVFNEIGNNFAISSGGLGEALKRSASSLAAANNTLHESASLITAANTVVQNPEKVGNAMKTISMRIRGKFVPIYNESYSLCYAV